MMCFLICVAMLGFLKATPSTAVQKDYYGRRTIIGTTESGCCVLGFCVNVRVFKGKAYDKGCSLNGKRHVFSSSGQVNIRYVDGSDLINIDRMLKKRTRAGRWTVPTYRCIGPWRAERR